MKLHRQLFWLLRRELWESRWLFLAPLAVAAVFLAGFLIELIRLAASAVPNNLRAPALYNEAAGLLMLTAMVVGFFYCADALQGERRDRSILFWKSLPVSDFTTVLAKAMVAIAFLPLLTFAVTFALQLTMLLVNSIVWWAGGSSVAAHWSQSSFFRMSWLLFYHLVAVHGLWHAPFYAWILFVSALTRRAAIVWSVLPIAALIAVEGMVLHTSHLTNVLQNRLSGGGVEAMVMPGTFPMDPTTHLMMYSFLSSPGLWIGLAVTASLLWASAQIRRHRGPVS